MRDDSFCFVCGKKNELGLKLDFCLTEAEELKCEFTPQKQHQGFDDIVHGGIAGLVLDEAMGLLLWKLGKRAVTADFKMRLKKPAFAGDRLFFNAAIEKEEKRVIYTKAACQDAQARIGISQVPIPNAFAFGRSLKDSCVCVTEGIMSLLNTNELKAVLGHEIAHIKNRDVLTITILSVIPLILYRIAFHLLIFGGGRSRRGQGIFCK